MTNEVGETAFTYGILVSLYGSINKRDNSSVTKTTDIHGIYQCMRTDQKGFMSFLLRELNGVEENPLPEVTTKKRGRKKKTKVKLPVVIVYIGAGESMPLEMQSDFFQKYI